MSKDTPVDAIRQLVQDYKQGTFKHPADQEAFLDYTVNAIKEMGEQEKLEASKQTVLNLVAQYKAERINHTLSEYSRDWKTELEHLDEFTAKFITQLNKAKDTE